MRRNGILITMMALVAITSGCGGSGDDGGLPTTATSVSVDIMSGLENPGWSITRDEANELTHLLSELDVESPPTEDLEPGLGFRGFVVDELAVEIDGEPTSVRVLADRIEVGDPAESALIDPTGSVYSKLKTFARGNVEESVLKDLP